MTAKHGSAACGYPRLLRVLGATALLACIAGCRETAITTTLYSQETSNTTIEIPEGDWPCWRGLSGEGIASGPASVTEWSESQNVLWTAPIPGRGHSTPILVGDKIFVTTAEEQAQRQLLLAYNRTDGKQLWSTTIHEGNLPGMHSKNSHASATPACDGHHVFCVFIHGDGLHVTAVDLDGKIAWQTRLGDFRSEHGYGSSPVLYKSLLLVNGDNLGDSFVAAVDRGTGDLIWKTTRRSSGRHGSYATPLVAELAGRPQMILSGSKSTISYDPDTGQTLWKCDGPAEVTACTPAVGDHLVFSSGGYPEKELLAIRPDGTGDIGRSHVEWRSSKGVTYVPSPLYHDGMLFVVNDSGIATCFDAKSGKEHWQQRLSGSFSASPVLAGDLLFVTNESGTTFVFEAANRYKLVASNSLDSGGFATPVICNGKVYLRTKSSLVCVGREG